MYRSFLIHSFADYIIHKNKFKVDKVLNISCDTIKVLEENLGRKFSDIPCSIFSPICPVGQRKLRKE